MFLDKLRLNNFRSFEDEQIYFGKDLTILVGENNGGKSNAIDALRLLTIPLSGRREIYCEPSDVRFGSVEHRFELQATFSDLSIPQQGRLISAVTDHTLQTVTFGLSYDETGKRLPVRPTTWAGHLRSAPEPGSQDMIRHVYLPPLRDAKRALASGNPTRIYALLQHFLGEDDPNELAKRLSRDSEEQILKDIGGAVDAGLIALTAGVRRQASSLGFSTNESLVDIARELRFKLADYGIEPEDLRYTGHGYANLLYVATIAVELEKVKTADLTMFLVEEPEAHLHPQLQAAVLCFLEEQAEQSKKIKPEYRGPAGQLQVIVATHSPNLSAWVASEQLVFFRSVHSPKKHAPSAGEAEFRLDPTLISEPATIDSSSGTNTNAPVTTDARMAADSGPSESALEGADRSDQPASAQPSVARQSTRCIPLKALALSHADRRKVDRYLDVTKSALLFGGRVLLVEGIAEALLLPIIAKKHVLKADQEKFRIFRSAVFVPIDGVDFGCYLRLLLTPHNEIRIADRVVIITDGDRTDEPPGTATPGELRKTTYESIAKDLGADKVFQVVTNTYSLETELVNAGNGELLKGAYLKLHPRSEGKWDSAVALSGDQRAAAIQALFNDTPKGDFAQLVAESIRSAPNFIVPKYLRTAIEALVQ